MSIYSGERRGGGVDVYRYLGVQSLLRSPSDDPPSHPNPETAKKHEEM